MKYKTRLKISALHKSHDLKNKNFIHALDEYLTKKRNVGNHCMIGDNLFDKFSYNQWTLT